MFELWSSEGPAEPRVALCEADRTMTYGELAQEVRTTRASLAACGLLAGDRVALTCAPTFRTIVNALALLELRCAILPTAPAPAAERQRSSYAVFAPHWDVSDEVARRLPPTDETSLPDHAGEAPRQALLTSGSSGQPRIVLRSEAQVEAGVRIFATAISLGPEDRVLCLVPLEHSFGFNSVMLATLATGGRIVLPRSRHPRGILRDLEESQATVFAGPPLFFDWMHRFSSEETATCSRRPPSADRSTLGRVRACLAVGDALPHAIHSTFLQRFGLALWQSYGASEAGPVLLNRTGHHDGSMMSLGEPYPEVEVELVDGAGAPVPDGQPGEIVARSPAVGMGYVGGNQGGSRIADGRFFSGDLGVRRGHEIHFRGRRKLLIARAGRKIDPGEIERVLSGHPDVLDAAVRAASGGSQDPLQAFVVVRRPIAPEELIDLCARALQAHKVPRIIEFRNALPRDAAGKLRRDELG